MVEGLNNYKAAAREFCWPVLLRLWLWLGRCGRRVWLGRRRLRRFLLYRFLGRFCVIDDNFLRRLRIGLGVLQRSTKATQFNFFRA